MVKLQQTAPFAKSFCFEYLLDTLDKYLTEMSRGGARQSRVCKERKPEKRPPSWPAQKVGTSAREKAQIMTENAIDYSIGCTIAEHEGLQQENATNPGKCPTNGFSGPFETKLQQIIEGIRTTTFPRVKENHVMIKIRDERRIQRREATIRRGYIDTKRDLARANTGYNEDKDDLSLGNISRICEGDLNSTGDRRVGKIDFMRNLNLTPVGFHKKIVEKIVEACGFYQCKPEKNLCGYQKKVPAKVIGCVSRTRKGTIYQNLNNNSSSSNSNTTELE